MPKNSKPRPSTSTSKPAPKSNSKSISKPLSSSQDSQKNTSGLLRTQQSLLNFFKPFFSSDSSESEKLLREIKTHLYNRDFASAFRSKPEYLPVYASRWSPSRALGYLDILEGDDIRKEILSSVSETEDASRGGEVRGGMDGSGGTAKDELGLKVICLGGGAGAELAALGSWWATESEREGKYGGLLETVMVDIGEWAGVVEALRIRIVTPPGISKYASAAVKDANRALLHEEGLRAEYLKQDVLEWKEKELARVVGHADVVTIMFTLNELYSASMPKTQKLLGLLTKYMRDESLLLVVDSPGSYSTVAVNGAEKKYPMQWLLDHTLLGPDSSRDETTMMWEKIVSDESKWFRLPQGLEYPMELENMRYQIYLYRRRTA